MNQIDDELARLNGHTDLNAFFQRIDCWQLYIYDNMTILIKFDINIIYMATHIVSIDRAYYMTICAWIDQKLTEISNKVSSSDCFIDDSCQKLISTKLNTSRQEIETVSPNRQCAHIESLHLRQPETACSWTCCIKYLIGKIHNSKDKECQSNKIDIIVWKIYVPIFS